MQNTLSRTKSYLNWKRADDREVQEVVYHYKYINNKCIKLINLTKTRGNGNGKTLSHLKDRWESLT